METKSGVIIEEQELKWSNYTHIIILTVQSLVKKTYSTK